MSEALDLLWIPFLAAILLTGIHTWFGIQVLSRNVVFVDLTLAQISALGATLAFILGHVPQSAASYGYSLLFTAAGAALLASSRRWISKVTQEAFIGVIYVVATAAALIMVDKAPQGAEHLRQMLVGSILSVTLRDVLGLVLLYGAIGLLHGLLRKPLLASAAAAQSSRTSWRGPRVGILCFLARLVWSSRARSRLPACCSCSLSSLSRPLSARSIAVGRRSSC